MNPKMETVSPVKKWSKRIDTWEASLVMQSFISGHGFLDDVKIQTARRGLFGEPATWIEMCTCPEGYVGQFCESCAPGFRHLPANGGPFASCIPCDCNNHADICDSETGE